SPWETHAGVSSANSKEKLRKTVGYFPGRQGIVVSVRERRIAEKGLSQRARSAQHTFQQIHYPGQLPAWMWRGCPSEYPLGVHTLAPAPALQAISATKCRGNA